MPGIGERQRHLEERLHAVGAEVLARLPQGGIEPVERDEQREDHQRQVVVDDTELHREAGVEQLDRRVAQAPVDAAGSRGTRAGEHDLPGDRADQEVREERDHQEHRAGARAAVPAPSPRGSRRTGSPISEAQRRADDRRPHALLQHGEERVARAPRCTGRGWGSTGRPARPSRRPSGRSSRRHQRRRARRRTWRTRSTTARRAGTSALGPALGGRRLGDGRLVIGGRQPPGLRP